MGAPSRSADVIRFANFEVDLQSGEVRKAGFKIKLEGQPFRVLHLLLERPGELITRDEVKRSLWSDKTFVDFDRGINETVKRLREALDDSAENPRFIETLRGRGYRFIYPLQHSSAPRTRRWLVLLMGLFGVGIATFLIGLGARSFRNQPAPPVTREMRSLAVLPLVDVSEAQEGSYFADGMTAGLIAELGRATAINVISWQSVMRYKGTNKPIREIARELGVDALLQGTVLREGGFVRVDAQLIQNQPEKRLWSQRFEREITSVLLLQSDVAHRIAREIVGSVDPKYSTIAKKEVDPAAYDAFLKGQYHVEKGAPDGIRKGIEYFRQALDIDPTFAPAWAGLSDGYNRSAIRHDLPAPEAYPIAREAAARALLLDDALPEAHVLSGVIKFRFDRDWEGAERALTHALKLNPSSSRARLGYGTYLLAMGNVETAVEEARRALALDPLSPQRYIDLAWKLQFASRHDDAIQHLTTVLKIVPDSASAHALLALSHTASRRSVEALASCEKALSLPLDDLVLSYCGQVYFHLDREPQARGILDRLVGGSRPSSFYVARLYDAFGDVDDALRWLERAIHERAPESCLIKIQPWSSELRATTGFQDLVRRMNFPAAAGETSVRKERL